MTAPPTPEQRVLAALGALTDDRSQARADLARATLRRVPARLLQAADPTVVAQRLNDAFDLLDRHRPGTTLVRISRPGTGFDGRPGATTVVEVATEDRPFLLSTVTDELERRGETIRRSLHPIVGVERDAQERIVAIHPARSGHPRASLLHVELEGRLPTSGDGELEAQILSLVDDVRRATDDHARMRAAVRGIAEGLRSGSWLGTDPDEAHEVADLLDWLLDDNLVLLGLREYVVVPTDDGPAFVVAPDSGLGLLGDEGRSRFATPVPFSELSPDLRARLDDPPLLTLTRTTARSTVQRRVRMEYLGLTRRDADGAIASEVRILGLFTRKGYAAPAGATPVLRRKLRAIIEREDVVDGSHDAVTLGSLFQALPKDELFQSTVDELHALLVDLLHAEQHAETRAMVRVDHRTRTVSVLVAIPRDVYSAELRGTIQRTLTERFGSERMDVEISLGDRKEALVRFLLHLEGQVPEVPLAELQAEVRRLARSWIDAVEDSLRPGRDAVEVSRLVDTIARRLPRSYRDVTRPVDALSDLALLDAAARTDAQLVVAFQAEHEPEPSSVRLRAVRQGGALELSSFLPILESLGLTVIEEVPHRLEGDGPPLVLHDFGVRISGFDLAADGPRLSEAILAAWRGHLVVDALNQAVLSAGVDWREVSILRAYRRLRRQLGTAYTSGYVNATIVGNPEVVTALVRYIHARFDPATGATDEVRAGARRALLGALDRLQRLDHDRILRGLVHLVDATVRTNAFRPDAVADGTGEPYVALKLDTSLIPDAPRPVPYREIFVHAPSVEGVHLRAGPVARGGLRWSDRPDDVRTEVLDLLKAQVLKNAVIVPTGAKGGFVLRNEPQDPAELRAEVARQYVTFIRGLLDVTDDLEGDQVVPPHDVVRHDGDDPYLVVAADRGTAALSDTANDIARRYDFWLDDAFASGGSNGYDHKALGVTARGAWVAIQRHFRELGVDTQREPVTIVGVGDMSGDVFGNGLLRSRTVQLVAAFDHRHIFLDPEPDPAVSFAERQRLFELRGSTWDDYDRTLLSPGGGVFRRDSRSVSLAPEVRAALRVEQEELSPPALVRAILCAPVDLLFAGGIGTFVRASSEPDTAVGDRTNDEVRVTADAIRARVLGEGANLFITQRGRLEYARHGGRINQDAIDNAAGVVTSDLEVGSKILLRLAQDEGRLDRPARDELLAEICDEVLDQVLRTVDRQGAALSRETVRSPSQLRAYDVLLDRLERTSGLDRDEELAPSSEELADRASNGAGLTRPELATLLAWAKRELKETLLASEVPDHPLCAGVAGRALPPTLVERFGDLVPRHRLRRELTATTLANDIVDRLGITFASRLAHGAERPLPAVVLAFQAARTVIDADHRWAQLDELEEQQDAERVREHEAPVEWLLERLTSVFLDADDIDAALVERHRAMVDALLDGITSLGTQQQRSARTAHARWLIDDLVDPTLARFLACARDLALVPDAVAVLHSLEGDRGPAGVLDALLRLGDALVIDRLEDGLERVRPSSDWSQRQQRGLAADLRRRRHDAAIVALRASEVGQEAPAVTRFLESREGRLEELRALVSVLERQDRSDLDGIAVVERRLRSVIDQPVG